MEGRSDVELLYRRMYQPIQTSSPPPLFFLYIAMMDKITGPPPPYEFRIAHQTNFAAYDIEVIKLTAQFVAASGRQFLQV